MAKNIAVIGDSESIKGFAAIGMDIYPCDDNENAPHLFRKIADGDNYAVIFITEEMFGLVDNKIRRSTWNKFGKILIWKIYFLEMKCNLLN